MPAARWPRIGKLLCLLLAGAVGCSASTLERVDAPVQAPVSVALEVTAAAVVPPPGPRRARAEVLGPSVKRAEPALGGHAAEVPPFEPKGAVALHEPSGHRASALAAKVVPEPSADGKPGDVSAPTSVEAPLRVTVPGDSPVVVYPAPAGERRVIIYLHGHCGSVEKIGAWAPEVSKLGTVIALLGNWGCDGSPGRFRWGMSIRYLNKRIVRAVEAVGETRPHGLDAERLTVIGYSQGAEKAEQLPRWYPERYPRIVLAGPPTAPHPWRLAPAEAVVIIAGENENQAHIRRGFRDLHFAGELAAFMELPEAAHGEFGPEGARVLAQALWWLYDRAP